MASHRNSACYNGGPAVNQRFYILHDKGCGDQSRLDKYFEEAGMTTDLILKIALAVVAISLKLRGGPQLFVRNVLKYKD
jgi:hypothetical protein